MTQPEESAEEAVEVVIGIPECDQYLALYKRCEPELKEEIMAGDRRFYKSERGSLEYFAKQEGREQLPAQCADMLEQLRKDCTVE